MTTPGPGGHGGGGEWRWVALALPIAAVAVLLLAALSMFGLRGGAAGDTEDAAPAPTPSDPGPVAVVGPSAAVDAVLVVDAHRSGLRPPPVLAGVGAGDVVEVRGQGFAGDADGVIAQCDAVGGRRCHNLFPVRTDGNGDLRAQYRLSATPRDGALVVEVDLDRGGALVAATNRPDLRIAGATLVVSGALPGTDLAVLRCGRHADAPSDCREGPELTVASDGAARVDVGDTRRGERVVVVDASGTVVGEPLVLVAPISPAAAVDDVDLDSRRVAAGLLVALLLVGVAAQLIRSTDWRVPAEAEVPTVPGTS